jgi:hypothetical protein
LKDRAGEGENVNGCQNPQNLPMSPSTIARTNSLKGKQEDSPKIISYRKSKRTTSDGSYAEIYSPTEQKDYDQRLYTDEFFKGSSYRYAVMKRNIDFHQLFRTLDLTDRFLDDFSCALSKEILLQGRIYISEHYVCFNSNLLGWVTNLVIPMSDIVRFEKKSTAGLFPNGIMIETKDNRYNFASFVSRDATFNFIKLVWQETTGNVSEDDTAMDDDTQTTDDLIEVSTPKIESYIMSIDGDDSSLDEKSDLDGKLVTDQKEQIITTKVLKFKEESNHKNMGPDVHAPTSVEDRLTPHSNEIELFDEIFEAPMGVVYDLIFGTTNTSFHRNFLQDHDGSEISEFDLFHPMEDDPTKLERTYTYRRALGYSIGPKSTKCEVSEIIEHLNFSDYITVLTTTVTPDVPLGNSFSVKTRYTFTWDEDNCTRLKLSFYIDWVGKSWIKAVIEKQSLSGQKATANDLIVALKEEIREQTYYIDGPTLVKTTTPAEISTTHEPITEEAIVEEIKAEFSGLSLSTKSLTLILTFMGLILILLVGSQIIMYRGIQETNTLIRQQILMNNHLMLAQSSRSRKLVPRLNEFWDLIMEKVGKKFSPAERVDYLLEQLDLLFIDNNEEGAATL